ncbi:MAG: translocation/assembly module TamB domain-containing protein [Bacteroidota bacterium]
MSQADWILEKQIGTEVQLEEVSVVFPDKIALNGISIKDQQDEDLLQLRGLHISVLNFSLWHYLFSEDSVSSISVNGVELNQPDLFIYRRKRDSSFNFQFIIDAFTSDQKRTGGKQIGLVLSDLILHEAELTYIDSTSQKIDSIQKGRFIPQYMHIEDLEMETYLSVLPDLDLDIRMNSMSGRELNSGLQISFLSFNLLNKINPNSQEKRLVVNDFSLRTYESNLVGKLNLLDQSLEDVIKHPEDFRLEARLYSPSVIQFSDLDYFVKDPLPVRNKLRLIGYLQINKDKILGRDLRLSYGTETEVIGRGDISHYLDRDNLFMNLDIEQSRISLQELQDFIPSIGIPKELEAINQLQIDGQYNGGLREFTVDMGMNTELGKIVADLDMVLPENGGLISYDGKILTENLNVNGLGLDEISYSKRLNLSGTIYGRGFTLEDADALLDLSLRNSDVQGYQIDTASAKVSLKEGNIVGRVFVKDPEGSGDVNVDLNLLASPAVYKLDGQVKNLNLKKYKLGELPIQVSSDVHIKLQGDSIDVMKGFVKFQEGRLANYTNGKIVDIPGLFFESAGSDQRKYINLKSSLVDADIVGPFTYQHSIDLFSRLSKEIRLYIQNNDSLTQEYYSTKEPDTLDLDLQMAIAFKDSFSNILDFLDIPLFISSNTLLTGRLNYVGSKEASEERERLSLSLVSDSIKYQQIQLDSIDSDLIIFKHYLLNDFKMDAGLFSKNLGVGPTFNLEKVILRSNLQERKLLSNLNFKQTESKGIGEFKTTTNFNLDGSVVTYFDTDKSSLKIHGDTLNIQDFHQIVFSDEGIDVVNLVLTNDERYYRLNGMISDTISDAITLTFNRFSMETLQEFYPVEQEVEGYLGGSITARSVLGSPVVEGGVRLTDFKFEGYEYGEIFVLGEWDDTTNTVALGSYLYQATGDTILKLVGNYHVEDTLSPMDFKLESPTGLPIKFIAPFVKGELYDLKGNIGLESFTVKGQPQKPIVLGTGKFEDAAFGVSYFKTYYRFNGPVVFDEEHMTFQDIQVRDKFDNVARLHGDIRHKGFREFAFNLQLESARNFLLMDTKKYDNDYFYGKLLVDDAFADITGDLETINITAYSSFAKGSVLNLPTDYESEFNRPEYIVFKGEKEADELTAETGVLGFNLDITAEVNENLDMNIIIDERVGDIISATGRGTLNLGLTKSGTFSMEGDYTITEGDYLFTMQNFINRRFKVSEGSKLTWDGDPFGGIIDIQAVYETNADFTSLDQFATDRVPTNVIMKMTGPLLKPDIGLEIAFKNISATNASSIVNYVKSINEFDEQELNNQVFSLIVFNKFAPQGTLTGSNDTGLEVATEAVATSLSELLNNQLNYWVSRATGDKLNINLNTGINQDLQIDDINLQVSAKLFGDRVKIERDGNVFQEDYSSLDVKSLIGNISLSIRLLPNSNSKSRNPNNPSELVLEVFGREDILEQENNAYQTGTGIFFKRDLDRLQDLFKSQAKLREAKPDSVRVDTIRP